MSGVLHELSAVEEFARLHDEGELPVAVRTYRSLVPASPPGPGQQYGFEVDLDACTGCKSCVAACHNLNGLDDDEAWRSVGLLRSRTPALSLQQTVTTACHHCVEPACLQGCPVDAYEKDPVTGIVAHLDDQCIGCGYCMWTCPYEVPQFSEKRGIVRKCDMCQDRLGAGEAPACVQSCPTSAIRIGIVDVTTARAEAATGGSLVPGAPLSARTVPTTVYLTTRPAVADLEAADRDTIRPSHAHPPLALMLVLTQVAVGAVLVDAVVGGGGAALGAVMGVVALAASIGHLGRPQYAFRAVLGFRHSWLSREVVAFGAFGPLAVAAGLDNVFAAAAAVAGVVGVACSVMIYAVCGRRWWSLPFTACRFGLTTATGGLAATLAVAAATGAAVGALATAVIVAAIAKLLSDAVVLVPRRAAHPELARTAVLLRGELARFTTARFLLGALGGVVAPALTSVVASGAVAVAVVGFALLVAGELVERSLFFTAEAGPRMPGPRP